MERKRKRILTDDELRAIWKTANATEGPFGAFLQFLLLTGARRNEAAGITVKELETVAPEAMDWILPASRNKVKIDLARPLPLAAQVIIKHCPASASVVTFSQQLAGHRLAGLEIQGRLRRKGRRR